MGIKTKIGLSVLFWVLGMCILPFPADCASKYVGMYFTYYNENNEMHILFETDNGVDNDYNHRRLYFEYGEECSEPDWSYDYKDYNFWPDEFGDVHFPGVVSMKDRRLWKMKATGLTPGCHYDVRFSYRDTNSGGWDENWGHFYAPPTIGVEGNPVLQFYAYGDCKVTGDESEEHANAVAKAIMDHAGKKTFVLHVGDRANSGGSPLGWYQYDDEDDGSTQVQDHINDNMNKYYFGLGNVHDLLCEMPIFTTLGNHDFEVTGEGNGKDCVEYYKGGGGI